MVELKVSSKSNPNAVAGAIAGGIKDHETISIKVVGAGALNQAVKAVTIARGFVVPLGFDLIIVPHFIDIELNEVEKTGLKLVIKKVHA